MGCMSLALAAALCGTGPVPQPTPTSPAPMTAVAEPGAPAPERLAQYLVDDTAAPPPPAPNMVAPTFASAPPMAPGTAYQVFQETTGLFYSDHDFDNFTGPLTNPVQAKDPRSLTEARVLFANNWGKKGFPVFGSGVYQVYALQLRLAVTERLQLFADKDGIVRFSPAPNGVKGKSVTGLANLAFGGKYVLIRDVENQFIFSTAIQYEAPTGYANIFQNQGSGMLALYGVMGKQFGENTHVLATFGQNFAVQNQLSGYFYTNLHVDQKIGWFYPFLEANWYAYNQNGRWVPPVGIEGDGWINTGTRGVAGKNLVTLAPGFKIQPGEHPHVCFGVAYEFPVSEWNALIGNRINAELIFRY